jgi:hypothetical protein
VSVSVSVSVSPSPSASSQPEAAATIDQEAAVAAWVWWLLGLLVVAALLAGAALLRRRRRRADWSTALDDALGEASWLSGDLIPTLLGQSASGRSGVWAIGRARVLRLEQSLDGLAERAPDDVTARHCATLSSAVQGLRRAVEQAEAAGVLGGETSTSALRQAQRELDAAIVALTDGR